MSSNGVAAWSFSRYETYQQCPLKFKLRNIDKMEEPKSEAQERGIKKHEDAARFLQGAVKAFPPGLVANPAMIGMFEDLRGLQPIVEQQWGFRADWSPTGWFGKDTWFRATLDAAVVYEDGTADAVDHKTGKRYGKNAEQMELFALSVMCRYPQVRKVTTRLWYLDEKRDNEVIEEYSAEHKEALKRDWERKAAPMFNDTTFAPRPNDKCGWCHFSRNNGGPCKY